MTDALRAQLRRLTREDPKTGKLVSVGLCYLPQSVNAADYQVFVELEGLGLVNFDEPNFVITDAGMKALTESDAN